MRTAALITLRVTCWFGLRSFLSSFSRERALIDRAAHHAADGQIENQVEGPVEGPLGRAATLAEDVVTAAVDRPCSTRTRLAPSQLG